MPHPVNTAVRAVALPTLACALVCGGALVAIAATAVHAIEAPASARHSAGMLDLLPAIPPPAAVVLRTPPVPQVTDAPTAREWVVPFPAGSG
jgi:hypothetical protein